MWLIYCIVVFFFGCVTKRRKSHSSVCRDEWFEFEEGDSEISAVASKCFFFVVSPSSAEQRRIDTCVSSLQWLLGWSSGANKLMFFWCRRYDGLFLFLFKKKKLTKQKWVDWVRVSRRLIRADATQASQFMKIMLCRPVYSEWCFVCLLDNRADRLRRD